MESEPMLTPREKSPLPKISPEEDRTRDTVAASPSTTNWAIPAPWQGYNNYDNIRTERCNLRFLQSPPCTTNCLTYAQVARVQIMRKSRAAHQALIMCNMLCAVWYEGTAQLKKKPKTHTKKRSNKCDFNSVKLNLSLTELKSHLFECFFVFVCFFFRSPAISLGFTTFGWDFCICDRF